MKANELMIGDYVTFADCQKDKYPDIIKIWQINEAGECFASIDGNKALDEIAIDDEIVGIPLTPEILEKNGFEIQEQGGGRQDVWCGFGKDNENDIEIEFEDGAPFHIKIDGNNFYFTTNGIRYVHELQHAFRLCGIEKEIEL